MNEPLRLRALEKAGKLVLSDLKKSRTRQPTNHQGDKMGISLFGNSFNTWETNRKSSIDPNPTRFTVLATSHINQCTIALVHYNGCTNYDGNKILFWNKVVDPMKIYVLDPHFQEHNDNSPFARFEPTKEGMEAASILANNLKPG